MWALRRGGPIFVEIYLSYYFIQAKILYHGSEGNWKCFYMPLEINIYSINGGDKGKSCVSTIQSSLKPICVLTRVWRSQGQAMIWPAATEAELRQQINTLTNGERIPGKHARLRTLYMKKKTKKRKSSSGGMGNPLAVRPRKARTQRTDGGGDESSHRKLNLRPTFFEPKSNKQKINSTRERGYLTKIGGPEPVAKFPTMTIRTSSAC